MGFMIWREMYGNGHTAFTANRHSIALFVAVHGVTAPIACHLGCDLTAIRSMAHKLAFGSLGLNKPVCLAKINSTVRT